MTNELIAITEAQVNILTQSTPPDVIKTRKGRGGKMLSYVSHDWVTRQLNEAFNWHWSFEVLNERLVPTEADPQEVIVKGRLTVHTPNGDWVKNQFGSSEVKRDKKGAIVSLGDDFKAAGSDALKKCASLLGLALDMFGDQTGQPARPGRGRDVGQVVKQPARNGNGANREDYIARIRELEQEVEYFGDSVTIDPEFLKTASITKLTEFGKMLSQQVTRLKEQANQTTN